MTARIDVQVAQVWQIMARVDVEVAQDGVLLGQMVFSMATWGCFHDGPYRPAGSFAAARCGFAEGHVASIDELYGQFVHTKLRFSTLNTSCPY